MKQDRFIKILEVKEIRYEIKNNIITVLGDEGGDVDLHLLKSLPEHVQFNNSRTIFLDSLKSLHEYTFFNNGGNIYLTSIESLPENTQFYNGGM